MTGRETDTRTPDQLEFNELEYDPVYGRLLEETVLQYLIKHEPQFSEKFEDHLSEDGFLISKSDTGPRSKPSIHITERYAADEVVKMVREKLHAPKIKTDIESKKL